MGLICDIHTGDALEVGKTLPTGSVHCMVSSPPYWGLRDYGVDGQLGLEQTPEEYVERLVAIQREYKRVLRDDGTLWLNLWDSYAGGYGAREGNLNSPTALITRASGRRDRAPMPAMPLMGEGLKPKDLVGIPWMIAFALRADGWWLRSAIIWHKPNCRPESVRDRPTNDYEYVFLFAKSKKYFYDQDAIREPSLYPDDNKKAKTKTDHKRMPTDKVSGVQPGSKTYPMRNKRAVWTLPTKPSSEPHFAMFPLELPETCILAGTSGKGCCPECGSPWVRVVEKSRSFESGSGKAGNIPQGKHPDGLQGGGDTLDVRMGPCVQVQTLGWRPSCECDAGDPVPSTVLDMFSGMGNTGRAAFKHGRNYIGVELNPKYAEKSKVLIQGQLFAGFGAAAEKGG
jgi:DNA modification methylase